jgi:hypothetical protein
VTLPKLMTSGAKSEGRFGKQNFVYLPIEDVYHCRVGQKLSYRYTNEEEGKTLRRYWTTACPGCPQISMHNGTRAAHHAMEARTCA